MTGVTHDQLVYVPFSQECPYMSATERIFGDPDGSVTPDYWVIPEPRYPNQIENEKKILGYDMRYIGVGRELHLSEKTNNDILPMVRKELRGIFHYATADLLRIYPAYGSFTSKWTPSTGMSRFDRRRSVLPLDYFQIRAAEEPSGKVHEFFNKHIAVYFEKVTHNRAMDRYIFRHWLRMHDLQPPFQRGHFLAKAIQFVERARVGGQDEGRESTLHEVLTFHKSLCNSVIAREDDVMAPEHPPRITKRNTASDHDLKYYSYYYPGSPDPIVGFRPFLDQRLALTWKQQGFHLGHLFRSLVMVADDRGSADSVGTKPWYHTTYCMKTPPGRYKNLRSAEREVERGADHSVSSFQVLLIRTGDENHLSAPISFQPIFEAGKALPLERPDLSTSTLSTDDIVRVRLDDALEFISALIRREEDALPSSVGREAAAVKDEITELCEEWIERVLKHASVAGGMEHNVYTRQALGRARARLNGEAFDTDQLPPDGYVSSWET
ncbi:hypothetical protein QBC37DRAFT_379660 [Rhypophila decipiens]|uniref:Uncharacterized protein n=1 Tax=Rhypophila decipiens TaxID=261697 RepID=A0AAN6XYC1_9PEZI|nr:hypothetical protein QBC37DRAFT_379660 [Rhypophila decipiens]